MRGETVSHYEVLEELGGGGMGVVYKALDTRLRRNVALKFLPAELTRHSPAKQRFLLEARAASALDHPNVCTVYEVDETPDGRLFIAMAYYQGETLRQRIEHGPVALAEALKIAIQAARGLEAAHRAGIVHRDVKPANIMLPSGGEVKVLDFGLAKLEGEARRLTRTGTTLGTVAYMSPEQATGAEVDARSDLWSLGVVLYEMLTGRLPFKGERDHTLVYSILHDPPEPLRPHCPGAPRAMERLIERLLEKDPRHRYQTASELVASLEALARGESLAPTELAMSATLGRALRRRRRGMVWAAAAAVAAAALAFGAAAWLRREPGGGGGAAPGASRAELRNLAVLPFANLTGDPGRDYFCEGLSAVLIQQLSSLPSLNVLGRSDTLDYRGTQKRAKEIGTELGVGALVDGQVLRLGENLRVQASLRDATNGIVLWTRNLDGQPEEILRNLSQVGLELVERLSPDVTAEERRRLTGPPPASPRAYDAYLKALRVLDQVDNSQRFDLATDLLEDALAVEPGFAAARAQLSGALAGRFESERDPELIRRAEAEARRARADDEQLVEAHTALARVLSMTGRHSEAAAELRRLVTEHPDSDIAYTELARAYGEAGDFSRAEGNLREAIKRRPYWRHWNDLGILLWKTGDYAAAADAFEKAAELAPEITMALQNLGAMALQRGKFDEAIEVFERIPKPITDAGLATNLGTAYFYLARLEEAEQSFRLAVRLQPNEELFHSNLGDLLVQRDRPTEARAAYRAAARLLEEELKVNPTNNRVAFRFAVQRAKTGDCSGLEEARTLSARIPATDMAAHRLAEAAAACGDRKGALAALRLAVERGYPAVMLSEEADLFGLAGDPEFVALTNPD